MNEPSIARMGCFCRLFFSLFGTAATGLGWWMISMTDANTQVIQNAGLILESLFGTLVGSCITLFFCGWILDYLGYKIRQFHH